GLNFNAAKISLASNNYGSLPGKLIMDVISFHGGEYNCYSSVPEGDVLATVECKNYIDAIGEVTSASGAAIKSAQDAFDALSEYLQGLVTNANILREKTREYNLIAADVAAANKVDKLVNALSGTITDDNYEDYLVAYFEYLDIFPRVRKYLTAEAKLLKAVVAYEKANPDVKLSNESMNLYTNGKMAHYLSKNADKNSNKDTTSPLTGKDVNNLMMLFSFISLISAFGFFLVVRRIIKNK
ncbi:MAG: hypothetical protein IKK24_03920, partial [Clostridia bacterium]|nr:hypothetical protein [Clostridia bacterium]